jgi:glycosyltransferase involved in cell wall biosynthesis
VGSQQLPDALPDGQSWPRVSIVTPSYNQGQFIEETIRSVLLQGYPNLEYIIIDGGSTDESVDIIRKYESWLSFWVSEADRGQSHAINKGWRQATGDIIAWLNSDDLYTRNALSAAVEALQEAPAASMVYGNWYVIDRRSAVIGTQIPRSYDLAALLTGWNYIPQATVFLRSSALESVGWLDEDLHLIMDYDLWLRIGLALPNSVVRLPDTYLASYRMHDATKTQSQSFRSQLEYETVMGRLFQRSDIPDQISRIRPPAFGYVHLRGAVVCARQNDRRRAIRYLLRAMPALPMLVVRRPKDTLWMLKDLALGMVLS